jgi:hypothetical protein
MPRDCKTVAEAYNELKAQGFVFLDGQVLYNLILKNLVEETPLWNHPRFGTLSYVVFAKVLVSFKLFGQHEGFPTLSCSDNGENPELNMFSPEEVLEDVTDDPFFFAVMM